mgnify:CR=1 FL=1
MGVLDKIRKGTLPTIIAISALSVSASAAFYSVSGLSKLFAGASFEVIIMAGSLEVAKLVIASLLYQYWGTINKILRTYLTIATIILVLITSMGIYGFLSAAYQDTYRQLTIKNNKVAFLDQKREFYKKDVARYDEELERISNNISTYLMRKRPRFKYETRHHLQAFDKQLVLPNLDYPKSVLMLKKKIDHLFKQKGNK